MEFAYLNLQGWSLEFENKEIENTVIRAIGIIQDIDSIIRVTLDNSPLNTDDLNQKLHYLAALFKVIMDISVDSPDEEKLANFAGHTLDYFLSLITIVNDYMDIPRNEIELADALKFKEEARLNPKRWIWAIGDEDMNTIVENCVELLNFGIGTLKVPKTLEEASLKDLIDQYILHNLRMRAWELRYYKNKGIVALHNLSFLDSSVNIYFWLKTFQEILVYFPFEGSSYKSDYNKAIKNFFMGLSTSQDRDIFDEPFDFVDLVVNYSHHYPKESIPEETKKDLLELFGPQGLNWFTPDECRRIRRS